jgi:hypothetical protein
VASAANVARSAAEIAEDRDGPPRDRTGLVGSWSFDEGQGLVAKDDSVLRHDATLMRIYRTDARILWIEGHK